VELVNSLLFLCGFLIAAAAIYRYTRNFIIPGVTIMMFLGAASILIPLFHSELDRIYDFTTNRLPDLIFLVILPILIFESGRNLKLREIRSEIIPRGTKRFTVPKRLNLIIEGESIFNDATSLVSFNVITGIMFSGITFSLLSTSVSFLWSMLGAVILGSAIGYVGGKILNKWQGDEHVNFTFSIAIAIGGYLIADHFLHVSGVVTTLFTAILLVKTHKDIFIQVREAFHKYWDYAGFMTNSFLFFIIGIPFVYEFQLFASVSLLLIILAPITIVMISRAIVVYSGSLVLRIAKVRLPLQWQNVLILGGLRGGIAVAMVLSLPMEYEFKNMFIAVVTSVVAINLVLNPILLDRYLKKSKLSDTKQQLETDV
jgi:monovalent cation:H+ antiporter, CPA1 family